MRMSFRELFRWCFAGWIFLLVFLFATNSVTALVSLRIVVRQFDGESLLSLNAIPRERTSTSSSSSSGGGGVVSTRDQPQSYPRVEEDPVDSDDGSDEESSYHSLSSDILGFESSLGSPLSQLTKDEDSNSSSSGYNHPSPAFSRNDAWLDEATSDILDQTIYPIGDLTSEEVESISGLMAAWARRYGSIHAALNVEKLLKRIVDDYNAGNRAARVGTKQYTYAIDAWGRSGATGSAERAQHIHDTMVRTYKQTGDRQIAPSILSYNHLLNAWGKSKDPIAPSKAELILSEMLSAAQDGKPELKPDAVTFSTIMDIYSRSKAPHSSQRCEQLFKMMDDLDIRRNVYTFSSLQNVYARSGAPDAAHKAKAVLDQMLDLYEKGDVSNAKPNCLHFNAVFIALSRTTTRESAEMANDMLQKLELPVAQGGFDAEPDRLTYALAILACSRCEDYLYGAKLAERNLEKMERRAKLEAERRAVVSSAAPPVVSLDIECFNVVLTAISRCRRDDACLRISRIIKRMEQYAATGQEHLRPNSRSWNAVLNAIARGPQMKHPKYAAKAEQILDHVCALHKSGVPNVAPDAFTFAAVLCAYQRSYAPTSVEKADILVRRMEELHESGQIDSPPDVYHYTILCGTWAKSRHPLSVDRCMQILAHMREREKSGFTNVRPNVRTYNAVIDCLCRFGQHDRAENLLYHMLKLYKTGDKKAAPDCFSFNSILRAVCLSKEKGSGKKAEGLLERFLEYQQEENCNAGPDSRSFTHIISHYGRSRDLDAPYRAEYMLNRMVAAFESGQQKIVPNVFAFAVVIDSYAHARHPDAGKNGERILRNVVKLKKQHPELNLPMGREIMNSVLFAWASCGDEDACCRAEAHLNEMERNCECGNLAMCPDSRSYELVLSAWSKSSSVDKARRALQILRRIQKEERKGNRLVSLDERAFSLVINTCAFGNPNVDSKSEEFNIAVEVFNELLDSKTLKPSSLTFGWFIQACARLGGGSDDVKDGHIERACISAAKAGLLTDFVFQKLRGAASEALFEKIVKLRSRSRDKKSERREGEGAKI